jgi:hypothetical protein
VCSTVTLAMELCRQVINELMFRLIPVQVVHELISL